MTALPPENRDSKTRKAPAAPKRGVGQWYLRQARLNPLTMGRPLVALIFFPVTAIVMYSYKGNSLWPCAAEFAALLVVAIFWQRWLDKRRRLQDPSYCHSCGYDLVDLPPIGKCPECGQPYRGPTLTRPDA